MALHMFLSIYVITFVIIAIIQSSNANNLNYVAFSFDTSEIIGNFWSAGSALSQLKKERFQILTKALIENKYSSSSTTAIIRVGGTDANSTTCAGRASTTVHCYGTAGGNCALPCRHSQPATHATTTAADSDAHVTALAANRVTGTQRNRTRASLARRTGCQDH